MSAELQIKRYSKNLCKLDKLVEMHVNISLNSEVSDFLIYQDKNFPGFLINKILRSNAENVLLFFMDNYLAGFCRIKLIPNELFLNNIYIKEEFQGKGFGKIFLKKSIAYSMAENNAELFSLDVFRSNSVIEWYKKLGLVELASNYWYEIKILSLLGVTSHTSGIINKDENGFKSLYLNNRKIASILNDNIILNDIENLKYVTNIEYKKLIIKSPKQLLTSSLLSVRELEVSTKLSGSLGDVLERLEA